MAEEQVIETEVTEAPETVDTDPYEVQAKQQGWVPQEEYKGDKAKWRSAKEFVERGELFSKIDSMGRELKETKKALQMLQEHHTKVKETEYKHALDELKALQKRHLEEGNSDGYLETTELLTDLKAEQKAREVYKESAPPPPNTGSLDPRLVAWQNQNQWYLKDKEMRDFADTIGLGYASRNQGIDPEKVLEYVAATVRKQYPQHFGKREGPAAVEAGGGNPGGSGGITLTEEERKIMNTFIRTGALTKEEYLKDLKRMRSA